MNQEIRSVRDLRRHQIVSAARALVAEGGLEALTIGGLERRLEFTRGVISYHFRDKDEIVAAVLESAVSEMDAATFAEAAAQASFEDRIRSVFRSKVMGFLTHREAQRVLLSLWTRTDADERAAALHARLFGGWRAQAVSLFRKAMTTGECRSDLSPERLAGILVGNVVGVVVQTICEKDALNVADLIDEAAEQTLARCRPEKVRPEVAQTEAFAGA